MKYLKKKKILLVFLGIFILTVSFIGLLSFIQQSKVSIPVTAPQAPNFSFEEKEVFLFFDPNTITASPGGRINADIKIDSGDAPISYIKLDISFDPDVLSNVTITPYKDPTSALSNSLIAESNTVNAQRGNIILTYTLINGAHQQKGQAILAKLSATYKGGKETSVVLFPDSTVATKESFYTFSVGRVNLDIFPR